ncbi:MAG: hypothetical protein CMP59_10265 [Flavobacteriales bacterium]|nr:hypothetical protein [Flavobacteriales bacterium]
MEISFKSISLLSAVVITGLSAGFFYAWSVSVIPGTKRLADLTYLESMQSINRAILNPAFFVVFFGSMILLWLVTYQSYSANKTMFIFMLIAAITYTVGTFGVTGMGNVPLNELLDGKNLNELSMEKLADFRQFYESKWNRLHTVRTVFSLISFIAVVIGMYIRR